MTTVVAACKQKPGFVSDNTRRKSTRNHQTAAQSSVMHMCAVLMRMVVRLLITHCVWHRSLCVRLGPAARLDGSTHQPGSCPLADGSRHDKPLYPLSRLEHCNVQITAGGLTPSKHIIRVLAFSQQHGPPSVTSSDDWPVFSSPAGQNNTTHRQPSAMPSAILAAAAVLALFAVTASAAADVSSPQGTPLLCLT